MFGGGLELSFNVHRLVWLIMRTFAAYGEVVRGCLGVNVTCGLMLLGGGMRLMM